jgi:hypothetical protein
VPREPQRSNLVALSLVGVAVVAGGGWFALRSMAQSRAENAFLAAGALADCIDGKSAGRSLPAAIDLMLPTETPFASCEENAKSLALTAEELAKLPLLRGYPPVVELGEVTKRLSAREWSASATDIAKTSEAVKYSDDVSRAAELTCLTAQKVGLDTNRDCVREPIAPPELPTRRSALDTPSSDTEISTVLAEGSDKDVRLFFVSESAFWLVHSRDGGLTFRHETLKLSGKQARTLRVAQAAEGRHYAVVTPLDLPSPAKVLSISARDRIEVARDLELPEDLDWLPGAPVFEVRDGDNLMLALALVSKGSTRGRIGYLDNKRLQLRKVPEGSALGAIGVPPSLLIGNTRKTSYELASYAIPNATGTWPKPRVTTTPAIERLSGVDLTCGAPRERHVPFVSRGEKAGTLLALFDGEPSGYPFTLGKGPDTTPVCGRCSPSLLTSSPAGPELWLPAQRALTSQLLVAPLVFRNPAVWPTARATCSGAWHALTWISEGRLFVQSVEVGTWQTSSPTLLAETNETGAPDHVTSVATQSSIIVFWWRARKSGVLRVEYAISTDGKTWT